MCRRGLAEFSRRDERARDVSGSDPWPTGPSSSPARIARVHGEGGVDALECGVTASWGSRGEVSRRTS